MRRRHIALGVLAVVAAGATFAGAGFAGPGGKGGGDSLYGGGRHGVGTCTDGTTPFCPPGGREFSVDAHSNASGHSAYGSLEYANPTTGNVIASADVMCLNVDGERAVIGGRLNEGEFVGTGILMYFEDRGRPGAATRDRVSPLFLLLETEEPAGFPRTCPDWEEDVNGVGYFEQTYGDVAVNDG
jgi:hypothetical protein